MKKTFEKIDLISTIIVIIASVKFAMMPFRLK